MAGFKNLTAAIRAPFLVRHKLLTATERDKLDYAYDNGFKLKWRNAADTADIEALSVNASDQLSVMGAGSDPTRGTISFDVATSASLTDQVFFIAPHALTVEKIECVYATANGAAFTAIVKKIADGKAPAEGVALHATGFDLNTTTNTVQTATLSTDPGVLNLAYKERLMVDFTGSLTSMAGLVITVTYSPGNMGEVARYYMAANGDIGDQNIFVAPRPMKISKILYVHSTACSVGSSAVQVTKCTGTTAAASGTDLLTNNTNIGFACTGTVNTVQVGALSATAANLRLAVTDRLALDFTASLTALAGVCIVVLFEPTYDSRLVTYSLSKNANLADQAFFIADRDYELHQSYCSWGTAGGGGAANVQLTNDTAADAPGAGTNLLTNDSNAGFQIDGTANTPELGLLYSALGGTAIEPFPVMLAGDRLSVDYNGTLTSLADVVITCTLKPI